MSLISIVKNNSLILLKEKNMFYLILLIIFIYLIYIIIINTNYIHIFSKPTKLLFVSNNVFHNIIDVDPYLLNDVIYIPYNYENILGYYEFIILIRKILEKNNIYNIENIGFMFHTKSKNAFELFENSTSFKILSSQVNKSETNYVGFDNIIIFARYIHKIFKTKNLDIIACSVIETTYDNEWEFIEKNTPGIKINMSTDFTGNANDWFLERGDRQLIGIYFNDNIKNSDIKLIA